MAAEAEPNHILYHHNYSICSIMARYSFALRGDPIDEDHEIRIQEKQIDILNEKEQLLEHYLCDINPAGEVRTYSIFALLPDC